MVIDDESRRRTQEIVSKEQTVVLKSLNELAPTFWTNPIIIKSCIIGSFASWVTVAYNPAMMAELHAHFVLQKVLECLVNDV